MAAALLLKGASHLTTHKPKAHIIQRGLTPPSINWICESTSLFLAFCSSSELWENLVLMLGRVGGSALERQLCCRFNIGFILSSCGECQYSKKRQWDNKHLGIKAVMASNSVFGKSSLPTVHLENEANNLTYWRKGFVSWLFTNDLPEKVASWDILIIGSRGVFVIDDSPRSSLVSQHCLRWLRVTKSTVNTRKKSAAAFFSHDLNSRTQEKKERITKYVFVGIRAKLSLRNMNESLWAEFSNCYQEECRYLLVQHLTPIAFLGMLSAVCRSLQTIFPTKLPGYDR